MMAGKIYVLFACDQWKSEDSMRMICATADRDRSLEIIANEIEAGNMSFFYGNGDEEESAAAFSKFADRVANDRDLGFVNGYLEYGHLEIVEDGEVM